MQVKFETIFFRQITAAGAATVIYSLLFGTAADALGPLFIYGLALCLQDWVFDEIRGRRRHRDHGYRNAAGGSRKRA